MAIETFIAAAASAVATADSLSNLVEKFKGKGKAIGGDLEDLHNEIRRIKGDVLESRIQHAKILEENAALKNEIARLKKWHSDKEDYEPATVSPGVSVYIKKGSDIRDTWYCPKCLDDYKKLSFISLGQAFSIRDEEEVKYSCSSCSVKFLVNRTIHQRRVDFFRENHFDQYDPPQPAR